MNLRIQRSSILLVGLLAAANSVNIALIDQILTEFRWNEWISNVRPVLKSFHQWWLHGDVAKTGVLKNTGDGGIWNQWRIDKLKAEGGVGKISYVKFAEIHAQSITELEKQWELFQRYTNR